MTYIEYDGIRRNLDHLAPSDQAAIVREVALYASEGVDVTKQPELWPAVHRNYRGPAGSRSSATLYEPPQY